MVSRQKVQAMKLLKSEYDNLKIHLQNDPILGSYCQVDLLYNDDIFHWIVTFTGPKNTPYEGGKFKLKFDFPERYNEIPPEVRFLTKIYHLNVNNSNGDICISTLKNWQEGTSLITIISSIFTLFFGQSVENPYALEMAQEYTYNNNNFNRKAKEWTRQYAK